MTSSKYMSEIVARRASRLGYTYSTAGKPHQPHWIINPVDTMRLPGPQSLCAFSMMAAAAFLGLSIYRNEDVAGASTIYIYSMDGPFKLKLNAVTCYACDIDRTTCEVHHCHSLLFRNLGNGRPAMPPAQAEIAEIHNVWRITASTPQKTNLLGTLVLGCLILCRKAHP